MKLFPMNKRRWGVGIASGLVAGIVILQLQLHTPKSDISQSAQSNMVVFATQTEAERFTLMHQERLDAFNNDVDDAKMKTSKVYQLTIDDRLTYYFSSIEEIGATLKTVLTSSATDTYLYDVVVTQGTQGYKPVISFKEKHILRNEVNDLTLTGTASTDINEIPADAPVDLSLVPQETVPAEEPDPLTDLAFSETITIAPVVLLDQPLSTPEAAAAEMLKANVKPATYTVASGDSPSVIARDNNMSLKDLYQLNEGLKASATTLQVGDSLIVEKLVPELSIITTFTDVYTETFTNETIYQDDGNIYKGLKVVADVGYKGLKEITDEVAVSNGDEISRTPINEVIISPAEPKLFLVGTKPIPEKGAVGFFIKPVNNYRLTSKFGTRWGRNHNGLDMAVPSGTSINAADGGTVITAGWKGGYGNMIEIDHGNGTVTRYGHNSRLLVKVGDEVGQGQLIAKSGNTGQSTGPHLHFEILVENDYVDPMDYFN